MSMVRLRRLTSDYERVQHYLTRHPRLQLIQAEGSPPERYQIEYRIRSLRQKDGELHPADSHLVEISLPRDYPRVPPLCRMLTPVFHPNIAPHAICIGDHWHAGESLSSLIARIGEILAYQSYNTRSPLNGEAARWTDQNTARLPLDNVSMSIEGAAAAPPASPAPTAASTAPIAPPLPSVTPAPTIVMPKLLQPAPTLSSHATPSLASAAATSAGTTIVCPACGMRLWLRNTATPQVRCPQCRTSFEPPLPQTV